MDGITIQRSWVSVLFRGLIAVAFGLALFFWPEATVDLLVILFGVFAIAAGVFSVIASVTAGGGWSLVAQGIVSIILGLIAFFLPGITILTLIVIIAVWAIITGVMEIVFSYNRLEPDSGKWLMMVGGILSIIFGIILAFRPGTGLVVISWIIGAYAVIWGILLISLSVQLRNLSN